MIDQARTHAAATAESNLRAAEGKLASLQNELELVQQEKDLEMTSMKKQHDAAVAALQVGIVTNNRDGRDWQALTQ